MSVKNSKSDAPIDTKFWKVYTIRYTDDYGYATQYNHIKAWLGTTSIYVI